MTENIKIRWNSHIRRLCTAAVLISLLFIVGVGIVYAAGLSSGNRSLVIQSSVGYTYSINLTGSTDVGEIIPGDSFSINPSIENSSTGSVYVFVRVSCQSFNDRPIYSVKNLGSGWTVIDELGDGENIVIAYGTADAMTALDPGDTASLTGSLMLDVSNRDFGSVRDNLVVTIHGCAVHSEAEANVKATTSSPVDAYAEYLIQGGE